MHIKNRFGQCVMLMVIIMELRGVWRKGSVGNLEMPPLITGFGDDLRNMSKIWANYW